MFIQYCTFVRVRVGLTTFTCTRVVVHVQRTVCCTFVLPYLNIYKHELRTGLRVHECYTYVYTTRVQLRVLYLFSRQ